MVEGLVEGVCEIVCIVVFESCVLMVVDLMIL